MKLTANALAAVEFNSGLTIVQELVDPPDVFDRNSEVEHGKQEFLTPNGIKRLREV